MKVIKARSYFNDLSNLLRCLCYSRIINLLQLLLGWWFVRLTKKIITPPGPAAVSIEPTTSCNLRCPECLSGLRKFTRDTGYANIGDFSRWLGELKDKTIWLNLYFQGEPFLHKELADMVGIAKKERFYVMISTNGHFLTKDNCSVIVGSGLDRLIISLDGLDQGTYEKYRKGGDLKRVMEGIENICTVKDEMKQRHPYLIIQCLLLSNNIHQKASFRKLFNRKGIDELQFKTAQFYDYAQGNPLMPQEEKHSRYVRDGSSEYVVRSSFPDYCKRMWFSSVITWNGLVLPCCYDKDGNYQLGDLSNEKFMSVWHGEKYNNFRKKVFSNRRGIDICTNCGEGLLK